MQRIMTLILIVVVAGVAVAEYQGAEYLRSAASYPYTFPCTGYQVERLRRRNIPVFECGDHDECIDASYDLCDGVIDCHNFADESAELCNQPRQDGNETLPSMWEVACDEDRTDNARHPKPFGIAQCDNGMCIWECDLCDRNFIDCTDASDELGARCVDPDNRPDPGRCSQYYKDTYNRKKRSVPLR